MDNEDILKAMRRTAFRKNNGVVLRTLNILRTKYVKLCEAEGALPQIDRDQYQDSINYLFEAEYIELRHVETKVPCITGLADHDYRTMEAKLTAKGIQLLAGGIKDDCVEV